MSGQRTTDRCVAKLDQQIRVKVRWGTGVQLVLCNGIGAGVDRHGCGHGAGKPTTLAKLLVRKRRPVSARATVSARMSYLYELAAGSVWTCVFARPLIRQDALIIAGTDDPVVLLVNARIMARLLLPHATLHQHDGGHWGR